MRRGDNRFGRSLLDRLIDRGIFARLIHAADSMRLPPAGLLNHATMPGMIVLESTRAVVAAARQVRIVDDAVRAFAATYREAELSAGKPGLFGDFPGNAGQVANLVLLADALNFCFWGPRPEYSLAGATHGGFDALLAALVTAARAEPRWADPRYWVAMPAAAFRDAVGCNGQMPMMAERDDIARQTGQTLLERFDGRFADAVESVGGRAWDLAMLLLTNFDSFRDVAEYAGQPVFFAKRAQITALDLSLAWEARRYDPLDGLDRLTAFADYRLPQALRHLGILELDPALAAAIDNSDDLIPPGSTAEVELRAATIWAVERMREALAARRTFVPAWKIDQWLWLRARMPDLRIRHHRTRTIYY